MFVSILLFLCVYNNFEMDVNPDKDLCTDTPLKMLEETKNGKVQTFWWI